VTAVSAAASRVAYSSANAVAAGPPPRTSAALDQCHLALLERGDEAVAEHPHERVLARRRAREVEAVAGLDDTEHAQLARVNVRGDGAEQDVRGDAGEVDAGAAEPFRLHERDARAPVRGGEGGGVAGGATAEHDQVVVGHQTRIL